MEAKAQVPEDTAPLKAAKCSERIESMQDMIFFSMNFTETDTATVQQVRNTTIGVYKYATGTNMIKENKNN